MPSKVSLCFDFGADTLKIAVAYGLPGQYHRLEKVATPSTSSGFPSIALYDKDKKTWLFSDIAYSSSDYSYIVKIKQLLSLVLKGKGSKNYDYYANKNIFPYYCFLEPQGAVIEDYDALLEKKNSSFIVPNITPRQVCGRFFAYINTVVFSCLKKKSIYLENVDYSFCFATGTNSFLKEEIIALAKENFTFGEYSGKEISAEKAIAKYMAESGDVEDNESFLLFQMGHDSVSVTKVKSLSEGIAVDGVEGHEAPLHVGGGNIDRILYEHLSSSVAKHETIGMDDKNAAASHEAMTSGKQFAFLKDIKLCKAILSDPDFHDSYVPISMDNSLVMSTSVSKSEFAEWLGYKDINNIKAPSFANLLIRNYIGKELAKPLNDNVSYILLLGGSSCTLDFPLAVSRYLEKEFPNVKLKTRIGELYKELGDEWPLYAVAGTGALFAFNSWKVDTVFSLSYGTWVTPRERGDARGGSDIYYQELFPMNSPVENGSYIEERGCYLHMSRPFTLQIRRAVYEMVLSSSFDMDYFKRYDGCHKDNHDRPRILSNIDTSKEFHLDHYAGKMGFKEVVGSYAAIFDIQDTKHHLEFSRMYDIGFRYYLFISPDGRVEIEYHLNDVKAHGGTSSLSYVETSDGRRIPVERLRIVANVSYNARA